MGKEKRKEKRKRKEREEIINTNKRGEEVIDKGKEMLNRHWYSKKKIKKSVYKDIVCWERERQKERERDGKREKEERDKGRKDDVNCLGICWSVPQKEMKTKIRSQTCWE